MEKDLSDSYHHFYTTGELTGVLYKQFNQMGRWMGRNQATPAHLVSMLSRTHLSKDQREHKDEKGRITLKTSFVDEDSQDTCTIKYYKVDGNIYVNQAQNVYADNLIECANLYADRTQKLNLPKLKVVHGNLLARDCTELFAPKLLEITDSLHFDVLKELKLESIKTIGNAIASKTKTIVLPKIVKIGKCLHIPNASRISTQSLQEIGSLNIGDMSAKNIASLLHSLNKKTLTNLIKNETEMGNTKSENLYKALQKETVSRTLKQEEQLTVIEV